MGLRAEVEVIVNGNVADLDRRAQAVQERRPDPRRDRAALDRRMIGEHRSSGFLWAAAANPHPPGRASDETRVRQAQRLRRGLSNRSIWQLGWEMKQALLIQKDAMNHTPSG